MKKIAIGFLLISFLVNSCKKGSDVTSAPATPEAKPTADFKITNLVSPDVILEENIADFDNQSTNAYSYKWDFGNGMTSTKQIPTDVFFVPCGSEYTISLTVTNKSGEAATSAQKFQVLCRGKNAHGKPPVHITKAQIPGYISDHE